MHDYHKAEEVIKKAIAYFSRESSWLFLAECYFANTLLAYGRRNVNPAREYLKIGLKIAEKHGYNFFLIISPYDFICLCETAFELLKEDQTQKVRPLLQSRLMTQSPDYYDALRHHPNLGIRRHIRDIELKNYRITLPQIRVRTLGTFNVGRVGPSEERIVFRGQMPVTFFKLILALGGRSIPVDIIKEYLWPEADPHRVADMFKSALYRLRKTLEPEMDKVFGSAYLKLIHQTLSIESELFDIDFFHFLLLKSRAQKMRAVDQKGAIKLYEAAFELYQGPFLPEEPYAPWAEEQRSNLYGSYIKMLEEMMEIYLQDNAYDQAISYCEALLRADQLHEDAYQTLMMILLNRGKISKALKVYDTLKSVLKKELDIEPDERSNALYRRILGVPQE